MPAPARALEVPAGGAGRAAQGGGEVQGVGELPPLGLVMCVAKGKLKEGTFWITPGIEVPPALSPRLSLRKGPSGHLR